MNKRERAERATQPADADVTDNAGETDNDSPVLTKEASSDDAVQPSSKRSSTPRGKRASSASVAVPAESKTAETATRRNPFARLWMFLTEVVGELKKVIWPSRSEMIRYTIVVLIFVVVLTAFIAGIDIGFAKLVLLVFG